MHQNPVHEAPLVTDQQGRQVMMDLFRVTCRDGRDARIFTLSGELDASTCRGLLEQLQGPSGSCIVVDLSELTFMDSSGLGTIHRARRRALRDGSTLVVCRPQPIVHRVFQLTGLDAWVVDWDPKWAVQPEGATSTPSVSFSTRSEDGESVGAGRQRAE
jgi:anti-anti-sigma factor